MTSNIVTATTRHLGNETHAMPNLNTTILDDDDFTWLGFAEGMHANHGAVDVSLPGIRRLIDSGHLDAAGRLTDKGQASLLAWCEESLMRSLSRGGLVPHLIRPGHPTWTAACKLRDEGRVTISEPGPEQYGSWCEVKLA